MKRLLALLLLLTCTVQAQVESEVQRLVRENNQFSVALYRELSASPGNIVVSPFNVSTTLAMAYLGARGTTAEQMESVLHYSTDTPQELGAAFSNLLGRLDSDSLKLANSLWIDKRLPVLFLYKSLVNRSFRGGIHEISFADPSAATEEINHWVGGATDGKIAELLQPGTLTSAARLILVSALHMKGEWVNPFDPARTRTQPFHVTTQKRVSASMMNTQAQFLYAKESDYALLALPYRRRAIGPNLSMVILLPDSKDGLASLERRLNADQIETAIIGASARRVDVTLPKFRLSNRVYARHFLEKMGMTDPFTTAANFAGITGRQDLSISAVIHQAYIDVDEVGTEAAAATAVAMTTKSAPLGPEVALMADRPFLYLILDMETKQILFIGRVANPVGE